MMTQRAVWIGMAATGVIMLIMLVVALREPARLDDARSEQRATALARGMDLYALNCAECHGSRGQGEVQEDATQLNDDYMRNREADWLYKAIERGRDDTEMAAFHIDEGGALNRQQIESLVTVIRHGRWDDVARRVAELGMISEEELALAETYAREEAIAALPMIMIVPTPIAPQTTAADGSTTETTTDTLPNIAIAPTEHASDTDARTALATSPPAVGVVPTQAATDNTSLPLVVVVPTVTTHDVSGSVLPVIPVQPTCVQNHTLARSLPAVAVQPTATAPASADGDHTAFSLYAIHCAECHGTNGGGVDDMPALNTMRVRSMSRDELRRISFDNPNIEGHDAFLLPAEKVALIEFITYAFVQGE